MDISSLKENITNFSYQFTRFQEKDYPKNWLEIFRKGEKFIKTVIDFITNQHSLDILQRYNTDSHKTIEECPLVKLSKDILEDLSKLNIFIEKNIFHNEINFTSSNAIQIYSSLISTFNSLENKLSAYKVLKYLDGHNKTLIILGPNGSGKTSLANYLKNLEENVKVIPASKPIKAIGYISNLYDSTLTLFNDVLYRGTSDAELLQRLIIGLCKEHDDIARNFYDTEIKNQESIYIKVKAIFDDFFEVQLNNSAFSEKKMKAQKGAGEPFDFNNMSDGERVAFFYIATVLAAPRQAFIIVDEPENHLNPAIYNKIWDRLITARNDCQFIFISHTIDFIRARTNFELVKIKNFIHPDTFEFEFLGCSLTDIHTEHLVEIIGSRKTILFCEGSKSDFDYKVYEQLFGEKYTIIATGSCTSVINSVIACNNHAQAYSIQSAIGIIDSDLRTEDVINNLKKQNIITLKCNEIEMLLLDELIFKAALAHIFIDTQQFEEFKKAFFKKIESRKEHIISRIVKTKIDDKLRKSVINDRENKTKEEFKNNLIEIFSSIDIDNTWDRYTKKIDFIIEHKNYEEALRFCCLEHGEVINGIANKFIYNYSDIALGLLKNDKELSQKICIKYFPDLSI